MKEIPDAVMTSPIQPIDKNGVASQRIVLRQSTKCYEVFTQIDCANGGTIYGESVLYAWTDAMYDGTRDERQAAALADAAKTYARRCRRLGV